MPYTPIRNVKKYYFITFRCITIHSPYEEVMFERLSDEHPVLWLVKYREQYEDRESENYDENYRDAHIIFWTEIPKEIYDKAKKDIN